MVPKASKSSNEDQAVKKLYYDSGDYEHKAQMKCFVAGWGTTGKVRVKILATLFKPSLSSTSLLLNTFSLYFLTLTKGTETSQFMEYIEVKVVPIDKCIYHP